MTDERLTHTQRKEGQRKWKVTERITRKEVLHTTVLNLYSVLIQHNQSCLFTRFVPLWLCRSCCRLNVISSPWRETNKELKQQMIQKKSLLSGVYMTAGFKSLYSLFLKVFPNHKRNFLKLVVIKDFIVYRLYSVSPWEVTPQLSLKLNGLKSREVSAKKSRYEAVVMVMFQEFIQFTYTLAKKKLPVLFCLLPFKAADEGPFSSVASVPLYFYLQHRDAASSFARIFYKLKWLPVLRWLFSR